MATIVRQNYSIEQRLGNDSLYGSGYDGDVTIASSSTHILTEDKHYRNLTLGTNSVLVTNGFRVYVSGVLTIGAGAFLGTPASASSGTGTVRGRVADETETKTYIIGPDPSLPGVEIVPADVLKDIDTIMNGWHYDPSQGFRIIQGAYDGTDGTDVSGSPAETTVGATGGPGAGGTGGTGNYAPANEPADPALEPGGKGNPGNPGNAGVQGATGLGGIGGTGGGLVVVIAKEIAGTGTIVSDGKVATPPTTGATGASGNAGTAGQSAPNIPSTFAGNYVAAYENPGGSGHNTGYHNDPTPGNVVPGNTTPGNSYVVPGNTEHKATTNPPTTNPGTSGANHHNYHGNTYHNVKIDSPYHIEGNPVPGNPTHVSHTNPPTTAHNEPTSNPPTSNSPTPGNFVPGNVYFHEGTTNPAYHNNEHNPSYSGGSGGAAGTAGQGGSGGTGNPGTDGGDGAIFIVTDLLGVGITRSANTEVIIVNV